MAGLEQGHLVVEASDLGVSLARTAHTLFTQSRVDLFVDQAQAPVDVPSVRPSGGNEDGSGSWVVELRSASVTFDCSVFTPHRERVGDVGGTCRHGPNGGAKSTPTMRK